jgi:hypothetical protein
MLFNDFERRYKAAMPGDVMCNRFIISMANITLMTHTILHRAKSVTYVTIAGLHFFLNRLVLDSPHLGRAD